MHSCIAATTSPTLPSTRRTKRSRICCSRETFPTASSSRRSAKSSARASCRTTSRASSTTTPRDATPMEMLRTAVSALSFSDPAEAATDLANERRKAATLVARLPTIVARHHRQRQGLDPVDPDPSLSYAENFLTMLRGDAPTEQEVTCLRRRDDPSRRARDERVDVHRARRGRHALGHALRDRRCDLHAQGPDPRRRERARDAAGRRDRHARAGRRRSSTRGSTRTGRCTASVIPCT